MTPSASATAAIWVLHIKTWQMCFQFFLSNIDISVHFFFCFFLFWRHIKQDIENPNSQTRRLVNSGWFPGPEVSFTGSDPFRRISAGRKPWSAHTILPLIPTACACCPTLERAPFQSASTCPKTSPSWPWSADVGLPHSRHTLQINGDLSVYWAWSP